MKKILLFSLIFILLFSCGKKSLPEPESRKIEKDNIVKL